MSLAHVLEVKRPATAHADARQWLGTGSFCLVLGLFILVSFPVVLLGDRSFFFRDFSMFSYPAAFFQRESFWSGQLPFWNPYIYCGAPFLAQWNTMCLYPPALFYLVLPLSWALSAFCLLHLFWAGLGMYLFARHWTGHCMAAAVAGVIFAFNGLSLNFLMWPSHMATYAWAPWVLWLARRAWTEGGRSIVPAVLAGSMQMLAGGPETIILTWLIAGVLAGLDLLESPCRARLVLRASMLPVLVAVVSAVQLLPFLELLRHSQMSSGYSAASGDWTMPLWGWANLLAPLFRCSPYSYGVWMQNGQYWTSSYYAGIATLLLMALAFLQRPVWRVAVLVVLGYVFLVLAWGETASLYSGLRRIFPPLGFVRYTVKFVIGFVLIGPLVCAWGFRAWSEREHRGHRALFGIAAVLLAIMGVILWFNWTWSPSDVRGAAMQNGIVRVLFLLLIVASLLGFKRARGRWQLGFGLVILALFWLDFMTHVPSQNPTVPRKVYSSEVHRTFGDAQAGSRVMLSPAAEKVFQQSSLADPVKNLARNRVAARPNLNVLDGVPQVSGFSSIVPAYSRDVAQMPLKRAEADWTRLLDLMGVSRITADGSLTEWEQRADPMPLVTIGQGPVFMDEAATRAALEGPGPDFREIVLLPRDAESKVTAQRDLQAKVSQATVSTQEHRFQTESTTNALCVVAQSWYPAWKAYVDGVPTRLWRANHAFQALQVPPGSHEVRLVYRDHAFLAGLCLSLLGLVVCAGLWFKHLSIGSKSGR